MPRYAVVLDACVLVPIALADTLLRIRISEDRLADGQGTALGSGDSGLGGRRSRL